MAVDFDVLLPKAGLIIGTCFAVSAFPTLIQASKDEQKLKSISVPGIIMGLACASSIFSYCSILGLEDCCIGNAINLVFMGIQIVCVAALRKEPIILLHTTLLCGGLSLLVYRGLDLTQADVLCGVINVLACLAGPLDTLGKLLRTRDPSYMNVSINLFMTINMAIWTVYNFQHGVVGMTIANLAGVLVQQANFIAYWVSDGSFSKENPLILYSELIDNIFELPMSLLWSAENVSEKHLQEVHHREEEHHHHHQDHKKDD